MNEDFEALQDLWEADKNNIPTSTKSSKEMISSITSKKQGITQFQYGNIFVLLLTLVVIVTFFIFIAPVQELLSRIGAGIMIIGLIIRIGIEFYSSKQAKKLDVTQNTLQNLNHSIAYLKTRKWIHKELTFSIIIAYTIGLFLIIPEFIKYLGLIPVIVFYGMYIISGIIIIVKLRPKIKQELIDIQEIIKTKKRIIN